MSHQYKKYSLRDRETKIFSIYKANYIQTSLNRLFMGELDRKIYSLSAFAK